ncbi:hypothetical protein ACTHHL_00480 [Aeribacillus composti]|uniref:hypothetical protein n=1 Tax=Aeribacillus composti TaxID=1868734 RepID=UPI00406A54C6
MLTYATFMRHAEKVIKTVSENRPELKGVYHHPDGSLVVTDAKRMYKVSGIEHDKPLGSVYTTKGRKLETPYPNVDRFMKDDPVYQQIDQVYQFKTTELLQAVDCVSCIPVALKETPVLCFEGNRLACYYKSGERAFYYLPISFPDRFAINGMFLLDALKLLKAAKCRDFSFIYQAKLRPIFLKAENITILIMPIKI